MIKIQPVYSSPSISGGGVEEALVGLLVARPGFMLWEDVRCE